jgi:hypothetical protein
MKLHFTYFVTVLGGAVIAGTAAKREILPPSKSSSLWILRQWRARLLRLPSRIFHPLVDQK